MDPTKLPTDNLYKFMSISGLVLLVLSAAYPWRFIQDVAVDVYEERKQLAEVSSDLNSLSAKRELGKLLEEEPKDALAEARKLNDSLAEIRKKTEVMSANAERVSYLVTLSIVFFIIGTIGGVAGIVICCIGFKLWYERSQKYLDAMVKKGAEKT